LPDVNRFLDAVVLPWLERFADAKNVRNSLAADDGWAISHWPWEIVAAFDILAQREDDLIVYFSEQQMKSRKWDPQPATKLNSFVESISARLSAKSAESRWERGRRRGDAADPLRGPLILVVDEC